MKQRVISKNDLAGFIESLLKKGRTVVAPVKEDNTSSYKPIVSWSEVCLDLPLPNKSAKEYFFAQSEKILTYNFGSDNKVQVNEPAESPELVIFGIRPCEAVSHPIMDKVFSWDYQDDFYLKRREKNLVISVACETNDEFCFCTNVGISPQSTEGSDIFMQRTKKGNYIVKDITDKGKKLVEEYKNLFNEVDNEDPIDYPGPEKKFDLSLIKPWLDKNFDHPIWEKINLPCVGCGICTFLCPTCHCFDIVDESNLKQGVRYKNWDACQFANFTAHASGHNPRATQHKRFRQRMEHKFNYYPEKFERTLCVGCGRCIRHCPTNMSLLETLIEIDKLAKM